MRTPYVLFEGKDTMMTEQKIAAAAPATKQDLHAPLRPLAIKAVVAAALMLKRQTLKSA
jgi:hypothetical protein